MRIGGFLRQSLIDWEGMIAAVIFTKGCNFRCGYCHNPSLVLPDLFEETDDIEIEEIMSYLSSRKQWIDGVVISGGEPTINPDLPDILKSIRKNGHLIKLDTNGNCPVMLSDLISERLVDFVAMDIKTRLLFSEYNQITNCHDIRLIEKVSESINILRKSGIQYQFRTTVIPGVHSNEIIQHLKEEFKNDPWVLNQYRHGNTVDSTTPLA